jgi:N-acetylmuramoyl-L-alanine amidase
MIVRTLSAFLIAAAGIAFSGFLQKDDPSTDTQKVLKTIVIDPGHGGSDPGAKGAYSFEKDICLDVSLKVGALLEKEMPEIKLVYTRKTDTYPALHARANLANESKGDLFLCIHVNSAPPKKHSEITGYKTVTYYVGKGKNRKKKTKKVPQYRYWTSPSTAKGTETYIWGAHKGDDKELAVRENAPMMQEENFKINYGDVDPNSPEFIALSLLKTKQYFMRSATLAGFVQDEFVKVGRVDRDVRQRPVGIWVLQATAMPSILVETGFISNPEEEKYLNSAAGQDELARCIVNALKTYIAWLEKQQENNESGNASVSPPFPTRDVSDMLHEIEERERATR